MRRLLLWAGLGLVVGSRLPAQSVRIYSEFQRIDPFGNILPVDKAERPREILSPAVARNGHASFHVAVTVPAGAQYTLFFGQNPEGALKLTVYKERHVRRGNAWVPDVLERALLPYESAAQLPGAGIPDQATTTFLLDLFVPPEARVGRMRLEAQLNVGERWVIYPLEVRIMPAVVPKYPRTAEALAPVEAPADQSAAAPWRAYLCGSGERGSGGELTVRKLIRRNAQQDVALARSLEARLGRDAVAAQVARAAGASDARAWCEASPAPGPLGAEWYLRVRDFLLRTVQ